MNKILTTRSQLRHTLESGRRTIFEPAPPAPPPPAAGPYIISISPDISSPNFEDPLTITITGGRFTGVSQVSFVAQGPVDSFVVDSDTQITVTTHLYGYAGDPVDNMFVTAADGVTTSPITPATDFWYAYAWPEDCAFGPIAVTANRIWTTNGSSWYFNSAPTPDRFIITAGYSGSGDAGWPSGVYDAGCILQDANYVYLVAKNAACVTRIPINFSPPDGGNWATYDTLIIPQGNSPLGSNSAYNYYSSLLGCQIDGTKMYVPWQGQWNNINDNVPRLLVIDLAAWSPAAFNIYPIPTAVPVTYGDGSIYSACVANGVIVVSMFTPSSWSGSYWGDYAGQLYYAPVSNPSTWTTINLTYRVAFGIASGNKCYFLQNSWQGTDPYYGLGYQRHLIIADCSTGTPAVSYVDMAADDANFQFVSWAERDPIPWASSTDLYIPANVVTNTGDGYTVPYPPWYLVKRHLSDGSADGGGSTPPSTADPYFNDFVLLCGFNGPNGSINAFDDSPIKRGLATFIGSAQLETSNVKFGSASLAPSQTPANSGAYWLDDPTYFNFGTTTRFTIEGWFYTTTAAPTVPSGAQFLISHWFSGGVLSNSAGEWAFCISGQYLHWHVINATPANVAAIISSTPHTLNAWHHGAVDFDGTTYRMYLDGVCVGTSTTIVNLTNVPYALYLSIGCDANTGITGAYNDGLQGYIDEVRITRGVARYATNGSFAVPTSAFPRGGTALPAANDFSMRDLGVPWTWQMWPMHGACYGGKVFVQLNGWNFGYFFSIANEDKTAATMYPIPDIPVPANDLFANATALTLGTLTTGNVFLATGEPNEQWPALWDLAVGTSYPHVGSLVAQYSDQGYWGPENTIWYKFTPSSTGDYKITYQDRKGEANFDLTIWSGSAPGSLTNLYQNLGTSTGVFTATVHMTAGTIYHLCFDRFSYYGLYGNYLPDLENDGKVELTIAPAVGACPSFVNAGAQVTVSGTGALTLSPPLPATRTNGNVLIAVCRMDLPLSSTGAGSGLSCTGFNDLGIGRYMGENWPSVIIAFYFVDGSEAPPVFSTGSGANPYNLTAQVFQYAGVEQFYQWDIFAKWYTSGYYIQWQGGSSWGSSDSGGVTPVRCPAGVQSYPYSLLINLTMYRPTETYTPSTPPGFTSRNITPNNWNLSDRQLGGDITGTIPAISLPETPTAWSCIQLELRSQ